MSEGGAGRDGVGRQTGHRRLAVIEGVLAIFATAAAVAWIGIDRTGAYFFAAAAAGLALVAFRTMQIDLTFRDAANRVDRGETVLAQLSGRQAESLSWLRRPLLVVLTEHNVYFFESSISSRGPVERRAYNDLTEFGLGERSQSAALRIGLPDRVFVVSGLILDEVAAAEALVDQKRPKLIVSPIAPTLEAQSND